MGTSLGSALLAVFRWPTERVYVRRRREISLFSVVSSTYWVCRCGWFIMRRCSVLVHTMVYTWYGYRPTIKGQGRSEEGTYIPGMVFKYGRGKHSKHPLLSLDPSTRIFNYLGQPHTDGHVWKRATKDPCCQHSSGMALLQTRIREQQTLVAANKSHLTSSQKDEMTTKRKKNRSSSAFHYAYVQVTTQRQGCEVGKTHRRGVMIPYLGQMRQII